MRSPKPPNVCLQLRLYVSGDAPNSRLAIANINAICAEHIRTTYSLEIVDLVTAPLRALGDGIVVTPTLMRLSPLPQQRMIGNLSDTDRVVMALASVEGS